MKSKSIDWISVCEVIPCEMIITDDQYRIQYFNTAFVDLLGFESEQQLKGRHLQDFCDVKSVTESIPAEKRHDSSDMYELNFFNQVDTITAAFSVTCPISIKGKDGYLAWFFSNVSSYKQASDFLQSRLVESESANKSKTFFMANISHGIRSHLNSILGLYQLVKERSDRHEVPREIEQYINGIQFSAEQLQLLVNSILDLTAIEKGQFTEIQPSAFHVEQFMQSIFELFKNNAAEKSLWFTFEISNSTPKHIRADRRILSQILTNLVDNAIKFTGKGNAVKLSVFTENQQVVFQVCDEGIGIEENMLKRIFSLSDHARSRINEKEKETGLGLTIAKRLADLIEGEISGSSTLGEGSVFTVRIPLYEAEVYSSFNVQTNGLSKGFSKDNHILIIEDDKMNNEVYQAWFDDYTFDVSFVESGEAGLEMATASRFDLIIVDIHLSGIDGIETIKRLRVIPHHKSTPIVVISASTFTDKRVLAFEAGCNDYFVKPLDLGRLLKVLEKYLTCISWNQQEQFIYPKLTNTSEKIKEELLSHYNLLISTPIYQLEKIIKNISEVKRLFSETGYDGPSFLDLVEKAAFNGEDEKVNSLTKEAIAHYYS